MFSNIQKYFKLGTPTRNELIYFNVLLIIFFSLTYFLPSSFIIILLPSVIVINVLVIIYRGYSRSSDLENFIKFLNDTEQIKQFDSLLMVSEFRDKIEKFRKLQVVQKKAHSQFEIFRNELLDNLSHELRTPMFAVLGFLETLQSGKVKDETTREKFINRSYAQALKLNELLNDMIELSALQSNKENIKKDKYKIFPIISEVVENHSLQADEKGNKIKILTDNYEIELQLNEEKFKLAFSHLVSNAIKYTNNGQIIIQISKNNNSVIISISDTGIGIPADEVERIFERLYRTKREREASESKGSGMGLAIVKHILIAHNAKIEVNSIEKEGTKFEITLPI